jgi:8-oxo-dGTP diphosphatase
MTRSAVLIVQDGMVACIERHRKGRVYYVFPGGGVDTDETIEAAAIREADEELGVLVRLGELAATVLFGEQQQFYFWAQITAGEFGTGVGAELMSSADSKRGSYHPTWLTIATLLEQDVRPHALAEALATGMLTEGHEPQTIYDE